MLAASNFPLPHEPPKRDSAVPRQLGRLGRRDPFDGIEIVSHRFRSMKPLSRIRPILPFKALLFPIQSGTEYSRQSYVECS